MDKPESLEELFAGRHFNRDVIILCVRWYLRFKLSLRDLVEMRRSVACRWPIQPSCDGSGTIPRRPRNAGAAMPLQ